MQELHIVFSWRNRWWVESFVGIAFGEMNLRKVAFCVEPLSIRRLMALASGQRSPRRKWLLLGLQTVTLAQIKNSKIRATERTSTDKDKSARLNGSFAKFEIGHSDLNWLQIRSHRGLGRSYIEPANGWGNLYAASAWFPGVGGPSSCCTITRHRVKELSTSFILYLAIGRVLFFSIWSVYLVSWLRTTNPKHSAGISTR